MRFDEIGSPRRSRSRVARGIREKTRTPDETSRACETLNES